MMSTAANAAVVGIAEGGLTDRALRATRATLMGAFMLVASGADSDAADQLGGSPLSRFDRAPIETQDDVRAAVDAAHTTFREAVRVILEPSAKDLASGKSRVRLGDGVSPAQRQKLQTAAERLMLDLPVGALSPVVAKRLDRVLRARGVHVEDLASTRLGDLHRPGAQLARNLASDLLREDPAVAYGLALIVAGAAGYAADRFGSEGFEAVGLDPSFEIGFLDDRVVIDAEAAWEAGFTSPSGTFGLHLNAPLDDATEVGLDTTVELSGEAISDVIGPQSLDSATIEAHLTSGDYSVEGTLELDDELVPTTSSLELKHETDATDIALTASTEDQSAPVYGASIVHRGSTDDLKYELTLDLQSTGTITAGTAVDLGDLRGTTHVEFNASGALDKASLDLGRDIEGGRIGADLLYESKDGVSFGASAEYREDQLFLTGKARYFVHDRRVSGTLAAGYRTEDGFDIELNGRMDDRGQGRIGLGVTFYPDWSNGS